MVVAFEGKPFYKIDFRFRERTPFEVAQEAFVIVLARLSEERLRTSFRVERHYFSMSPVVIDGKDLPNAVMVIEK